MTAAKAPKATDELNDKVLGLDGKTDRDRGREYNADTDAPGVTPPSAPASDGPAPDPQPTPEEVAAQEAALAAAEQRDGQLNPDEQAAADAAKPPAYIPGPGSDTKPAATETAPTQDEPTEPGWYATDDDERGHAIIFLLDTKRRWHSVSSSFFVEDAQWWYVTSGGPVKLIAPLLSASAKAVLEAQAKEADSADEDWV